MYMQVMAKMELYLRKYLLNLLKQTNTKYLNRLAWYRILQKEM